MEVKKLLEWPRTTYERYVIIRGKWVSLLRITWDGCSNLIGGN